MPSQPETGSAGAGQAVFSNAVRHSDIATPQGLVGPDGAPSDKRFSVYRNNVMSSLIDALAANFPAIQRLMGDAYFTALAREFISENPPDIPMLFLYGGKFADFLGHFEPAADYPYLADVARVEYAWLQAYHAGDVDVLDANALGAVPADEVGGVCFQSHPATWIFRSAWPAATLVSRNREGEDCSDIDLSTGEDVLITRPLLDVQTRILPQGGFEFLSALSKESTLEEAAQAAMATTVEFDLSDQIAGMLECGVFCRIKQV